MYIYMLYLYTSFDGFLRNTLGLFGFFKLMFVTHGFKIILIFC